MPCLGRSLASGGHRPRGAASLLRLASAPRKSGTTQTGPGIQAPVVETSSADSAVVNEPSGQAHDAQCGACHQDECLRTMRAFSSLAHTGSGHTRLCTHGEQHFDHVKHHATDSHVDELRHLRARTCGEQGGSEPACNEHAPSASAQRWEAEPAVRQPKCPQTVAARACPAGLWFALRGAAEQSHPATRASAAQACGRVSAARGNGSDTACNAGSLTRFIHSAQTSCDSKRPSSSSSSSSSLPAKASAPCESQPPFQYVFGSRENAQLRARRALRAALLALSSATWQATPLGAQRHPLRLAASPALSGAAQLLCNRRTPSARPTSARHSALMACAGERTNAGQLSALNLLLASCGLPPRTKERVRANSCPVQQRACPSGGPHPSATRAGRSTSPLVRRPSFDTRCSKHGAIRAPPRRAVRVRAGAAPLPPRSSARCLAAPLHCQGRAEDAE